MLVLVLVRVVALVRVVVLELVVEVVVELSLVPDVEDEDLPRAEIVRVELISRVPDSCLALDARRPLLMVVERAEKDWSGY